MVLRPAKLLKVCPIRAATAKERRAAPPMSQRFLAVAASMRRLPPVKKIIVDGLWGLRGLPLAEFEAAPHARVARSSSAYPLHPPILPNAPFPSSQLFSLRPEGKGLGVSGACPWRSLRQLLLLFGLCLCRLSSLRLCRHASIRTRFAVFAAGAFWCSQFMGCCHLSDELQDPSCLVSVVLPRPRSHPNSALSHTPQKFNPCQAHAFRCP